MKVVKRSRVAEVEGFAAFVKRWVASRHRGFGLKYKCSGGNGYGPDEYTLRIKGTGTLGIGLEIAARLEIPINYDKRGQEKPRVVLYHPQWFSDIEDMVMDFEAQGGPDVTVEVYESPDDKVPLQRGRL